MRSDNSEETLLALEGINKHFGEKRVLSDFCLSLERGEILFLLGPSGCGKTTLLRIIAGFEDADKGSLEIAGRLAFGEGRNVPPQGRGLGYVVQEGVLFPNMSVYRNIAYGLGNGRGTSPADRERIEEVMALTNISELADRMPYQISGGQQQRVALARALAPRPPVLLLDEPFTALDEHLRARIRDDVIDILRRSGSAAIIVTHDRQEALGSADTIGLIQNGCLVQRDSPENLYRRPNSPEVARFISDDCLVLPARLSEDRHSVSCALSDQLPVEVHPEVFGLPACAEGRLLLRGGQLRPARAPDADVAFRGLVRQVDFRGSLSGVDLTAGESVVRLTVSTEDVDFSVGEELGVTIVGGGLFYPRSKCSTHGAAELGSAAPSEPVEKT